MLSSEAQTSLSMTWMVWCSSYFLTAEPPVLTGLSKSCLILCCLCFSWAWSKEVFLTPENINFLNGSQCVLIRAISFFHFTCFFFFFFYIKSISFEINSFWRSVSQNKMWHGIKHQSVICNLHNCTLSEEDLTTITRLYFLINSLLIQLLKNETKYIW